MVKRSGSPAIEHAVLVTGFEPFGGATTNPSECVARALDGRTIVGRSVVAAVLPCVFGDARRALVRAIDRVRPELVVCVGEAGGRAEISVERVAINIDDARIPDNAGAQPIDRLIVTGGPVGYWSSLPIKAIVSALHAEKTAAAVSQSAGTFVCNHIFYALMHALRDRPGVRGGFVHVPYLPEQVIGRPGIPSMALARTTRALEIVIATSLATRADAVIVGGATH